MALLALGAAAFTALGIHSFPNAGDRIVAGVVTGVGFLGAGVVMGQCVGRRERWHHRRRRILLVRRRAGGYRPVDPRLGRATGAATNRRPQEAFGSEGIRRLGRAPGSSTMMYRPLWQVHAVVSQSRRLPTRVEIGDCPRNGDQTSSPLSQGGCPTEYRDHAPGSYAFNGRRPYPPQCKGWLLPAGKS